MRHFALACAALALASCGYLPGQAPAGAVSAERQASFTALVEANNCRVDPASHDFVHTAGFSDAELRSIGGALVADGSAELAPDGTLILTTGSCL
jgi:hypothetical protein